MNLNLTQFSDHFTEYTELRLQENRSNSVAMVNGDIMRNVRSSKRGISARVYKNGLWGFASNPTVTNEATKLVIRSASENAAFLGAKLQKGSAVLPHVVTTSHNDFTTKKPVMSQQDVVGLVTQVDQYLEKSFPKLNSRTVGFGNLEMEKTLLTSEGSSAFSMIPRTLLYVVMSMEKDGEPFELMEIFGGLGQPEDVFTSADVFFPDLITQYEHLVKKSEGVYAQAGIHDCILDADLAGILAHEAIGHTTEADIVLGGSIAGEYMNEQVASPLITMVDYANTAFGETCPVPVYVDDEGSPAEDVTIIKDGVLKSYMHNKETASRFGVAPTGNARAFAFFDEPLVRMRNTTIKPGTSKLDDMIRSIDDGYYLIKSGNGQADSTSEFMFGVVLGYEIKNGKLGRAIRDTTISGVAFDLLKGIDMVSDDMSWSCAGMCGKKQSIPVGMGGPAVKCKINIGGK